MCMHPITKRWNSQDKNQQKQYEKRKHWITLLLLNYQNEQNPVMTEDLNETNQLDLICSQLCQNKHSFQVHMKHSLK